MIGTLKNNPRRSGDGWLLAQLQRDFEQMVIDLFALSMRRRARFKQRLELYQLTARFVQFGDSLIDRIGYGDNTRLSHQM